VPREPDFIRVLIVVDKPRCMPIPDPLRSTVNSSPHLKCAVLIVCMPGEFAERVRLFFLERAGYREGVLGMILSGYYVWRGNFGVAC
jgi:hypothetical protein